MCTFYREIKHFKRESNDIHFSNAFAEQIILSTCKYKIFSVYSPGFEYFSIISKEW